MASKKQKFRERLWKKDPHCHHCGILTVLINKRGGRFPDNAATIDHLFTRLDPERGSPLAPGERRWLLSCWKCNNARGAQRESQLSIEERWERSRRMPKRLRS